jgi:hypothetical protein
MEQRNPFLLRLLRLRYANDNHDCPGADRMQRDDGIAASQRNDLVMTQAGPEVPARMTCYSCNMSIKYCQIWQTLISPISPDITPEFRSVLRLPTLPCRSKAKGVPISAVSTLDLPPWALER